MDDVVFILHRDEDLEVGAPMLPSPFGGRGVGRGAQTVP